MFSTHALASVGPGVTFYTSDLFSRTDPDLTLPLRLQGTFVVSGGGYGPTIWLADSFLAAPGRGQEDPQREEATLHAPQPSRDGRVPLRWLREARAR